MWLLTCYLLNMCLRRELYRLYLGGILHTTKFARHISCFCMGLIWCNCKQRRLCVIIQYIPLTRIAQLQTLLSDYMVPRVIIGEITLHVTFMWACHAYLCQYSNHYKANYTPFTYILRGINLSKYAWRILKKCEYFDISWHWCFPVVCRHVLLLSLLETVTRTLTCLSCYWMDNHAMRLIHLLVSCYSVWTIWRPPLCFVTIQFWLRWWYGCV